MRSTGIILLFAGTLMLSTNANAQVGIAAGLNFESLGDIQATSRTATIDNSTGYHVGIFFDLGAGPVSLRPGVFYRSLGDVVVSDGIETSTFDLNMVEVPVDVRLRFATASPVVPYVFGGPVVGFASSKDEAFNDAVRNLLLSANVGGGVELRLGAVTLSPELRFGMSLNRWLEAGRTIQVGGAEIVAEEVARESAVMLRLGIGF